jgi:putative membrane protein
MFWNGGHMVWMWVYWVIGFALFVLLVRWAVISSAGQSRRGESPERILKQRYARGEIERDEYLRQLAELRR